MERSEVTNVTATLEVRRATDGGTVVCLLLRNDGGSSQVEWTMGEWSRMLGMGRVVNVVRVVQEES